MSRKLVVVILLVGTLVLTLRILTTQTSSGMTDLYDALRTTENNPSTQANHFDKSLTIMSAYFNLGSFQKGGAGTFSPLLYQEWASVFSRLENNFVFYTDDAVFRDLMQNLTKYKNSRTKIVFVQNRTSLWCFNLRTKVEFIFKDPDYPSHHPNTVLADYPCSQHAKYELVAQTVKRGIFESKYYAWLDVGYFRDIVKETFHFKLEVPDGFNESTISYNQIANPSFNAAPRDIIRGNRLWVGGGMFIGTGQKLMEYFEQYKRAVHVFLSESLMNTDQQIVYGMFTESGREKIQPTVEIQVFLPSGQGNPWFYLGYHCLKKVNISFVS